MKIPIPHWYDRAMDRLAMIVLPPNKPIGFYRITWLDLAVYVGYPLAGAIALFLWTGSWYWFPAVALSMAFAAILWGDIDWNKFKPRD